MWLCLIESPDLPKMVILIRCKTLHNGSYTIRIQFYNEFYDYKSLKPLNDSDYYAGNLLNPTNKPSLYNLHLFYGYQFHPCLLTSNFHWNQWLGWHFLSVLTYFIAQTREHWQPGCLLPMSKLVYFFANSLNVWLDKKPQIAKLLLFMQEVRGNLFVYYLIL